MKNGIINVYKEKSFTSHDVVAVLRGVFKQKKIGHTGTLDPDATGVLPICLGKGTKVAGLITDNDKAYRTTFVLGSETDTQDASGEVIATSTYEGVTEDNVLSTINKYIGPIEQIPPMYSAIKINGRKLYDLAREGKVVERKSRRVTILDIYDIRVELPYISMTVSCSKGTYIRTLCRDIAKDLGTCGHMTELERIRSGKFEKDTALTLDEVRKLVEEDKVDAHIMNVDDYFDQYQTIIIHSNFYKLLDNGNKLPPESIINDVELTADVRYNVYNQEGDYIGVYEWSLGKQEIVPIKFFFIKKEQE